MFCRHLLREHGRLTYKTVPLTVHAVLTRTMSDTTVPDPALLQPAPPDVASSSEVVPTDTIANVSTTVVDSVPVSQLSSTPELFKVAVEQLPDFIWYKPTSYIIYALDSFQTTTGLPWWATLVCTGVVFRCAMFPVNVHMQKIRAKFLPVSEHFNNNDVAIRAAKRAKDRTKLMILSKERQYLVSKHGVSPLSMFKPFLITGGCTMAMFFSITTLTNLPYAPLTTTDFLWLTDLTVSDPYRVMAAFNGMLVASVIKSGIDTGKNPMIDMLFGSHFRTFSFIVFMGLTQSYFSTALLTYWTSSNLVGLVTVPLLKHDPCRKVVGLIPRSEMDELEAKQPTINELIDQASGTAKKVRAEGREAEMLKHKEKAESLARQALMANEEYLKSVEEYKAECSKVKEAECSEVKDAECFELKEAECSELKEAECSELKDKADLRVNCKAPKVELKEAQ